MSEGVLPYGRHWIDEADIEAVAECLRGDWLTTGPRVKAFEDAFAETVGAKYAVVCANGTAALHLAALAADVGGEDVCVAPTMSFLASANGIRYSGARIVFADADPGTGLVTPETFREALDRAGAKVKMAVVVHLNGAPVDMPEISRLADERGIVLVEDACHALGGTHLGSDGAQHAIGSCRHSAMTVFSLHPVKTITMGEGGVVTTNDAALYERLCLLRGHGMMRDADSFQNGDLAFAEDGTANPWYYEMVELGYNYRASDFACALAHSQLSKLPMFAERREALREVYDRELGDLGELLRPVTQSMAQTNRPVLHLYPVSIDFEALGRDRASVMNSLRAKGVGTQVHYIPIHRQPYYAALSSVDLPGADAYYAKALSLPYYPLMEPADALRVSTALKDVLGLNA